MNSSVLWTGHEAHAATAGTLTADWTASGVSIDSRTLERGDLFIALQGPNFDGHDFVAAAFDNGAAAALVSRRPDTVPANWPLLVVSDTMEALRALAAAARARSKAKIVAVTGSVGKTGTKEALRLVLSGQGLTHAAVGSFNNHWGVPLTLARLPREARFGVFEIGMNHPGEITPLVGLVRPHVAVITTVEAVHLAHFASERAIADAKAEIFSGLIPDGTAILNRDNPHYDHLVGRARAAGVSRIVSFGGHPEAQVRQVNVALHPDCSCVSADISGQPITYKVGIPGQHWISNSLAVLAAVKALGGDLGLAGLKLAELRPPRGRGERRIVPLAGGSFTVIDDSYNASPASMRAAFATLAQMPTGARGRRIVVLGDMLELGVQSAQLHTALAIDIAENNIDLVFCAGPQMRALFDVLPQQRRGLHVSSSDALAGPVLAQIRPDDVVLVKGSYGSRMGPVVDSLCNPRPLPRAANG